MTQHFASYNSHIRTVQNPNSFLTLSLMNYIRFLIAFSQRGKVPLQFPLERPIPNPLEIPTYVHRIEAWNAPLNLLIPIIHDRRNVRGAHQRFSDRVDAVPDVVERDFREIKRRIRARVSATDVVDICRFIHVPVMFRMKGLANHVLSQCKSAYEKSTTRGIGNQD